MSKLIKSVDAIRPGWFTVNNNIDIKFDLKETNIEEGVISAETIFEPEEYTAEQIEAILVELFEQIIENAKEHYERD